MTVPLDDKIVKQLHEEAEKFYNREWILDTVAIHNNRFLSATHFEMHFNNKLDKFRLEPPSTEWAYKNACEEFHEELIKAKTMNVIIEKQLDQELSKYKQQNIELRNQLNESTSTVKSLLEERGFLKGKLEMYERDLPKNDTFVSDVDE